MGTLKNKWRLRVLLTVMAITVLGCQKDAQTIEKSDSPIKIENINLDKNSELKNFLNNSFSNITPKNNKTLKFIENTNINIDNETGVSATDIENNTNYSFRFYPVGASENEIYNLIINFLSNGEKQTFVEKYVCDLSSFENFKVNNYQLNYFKGTSNIYEANSFFSKTLYASKTTDQPCPPILVTTIGGTPASNWGSPITSGNATYTVNTAIPSHTTGGILFGSGISFYYINTPSATSSSSSGSGYSCCGGRACKIKPGVPQKKTGGIQKASAHPCPTPLPVGPVVTVTDFSIMQALKAVLTDLTREQFLWLRSKNDIQTKIYLYLANNNYSSQSKEFVKELIDLGRNEANQEDVNNLANISLIIENGDYYNNALDDNFLEKIDPYVDLDLSSVSDPGGPTYSLFAVKIYLNYKKLRALNPEWSRAKCGWEATKDVIHISLDAFGLVPVAGEVADLVNGVLYTIEGDGLNATLSYASAIPIVGWAPAGTKFGLKVIKTASDINSRVKLVWKVVGNTVEFGQRTQLRKVLGLAVGDARQAHHIIPWAKSIHPAIQKAAKSADAFHMNEALNGIPLSTAVHNGSHAHYDDLIQGYLNAIPSNYTPSQCYDAVTSIINRVKIAIANNPNTPINQLFF